LQLAQLLINIGACVAMIIGYHFKLYPMQDIGLTFLLSNQSSIITMTLLFGPLAAAGQSAAILIAIASMINGMTTSLFNEFGGYLYAIQVIWPYLFIQLPVLVLISIICAVNLSI